MNVRRIEPLNLDACMDQSSGQTLADPVERLFGGRAVSQGTTGRAVCALDAPIHHETHAACLAAPGQVRDRAVLEETARL